ncbi:MAG: DUF1330 domain-containing protein [Deltaproteobacteria bacterium]|jgi:uncharacterized protein (DUF1330 family)|nr:DUF1330 domain-containing protein [Deltaproteobacteria bacterium]MBW2504591.1 DUF1330 domain-containing protein [Deltaproteobacteria bacterium]
MAAYLIGQIKVKNPQLWQQYVDGVSESLAGLDAQIVFRGKRLEVLAGENPYDLVVVIKFANRMTLDQWFFSQQYQALIPLRDKAAKVTITTYDG